MNEKSKCGNFRWQCKNYLFNLRFPISISPIRCHLSRIFYCNNVNIAKILSENYNVSNDDKSLHKAAAAVSEAAWSPWLVVSLLSLLVFPDLSKNPRLY